MKGAHANGCSRIKVNGETQLLSDFINRDKAAVLTAQTDTQFAELPYLFKVLAAGEALSVQVHPSKAQAVAGKNRRVFPAMLQTVTIKIRTISRSLSMHWRHIRQ